MEYQQIETHEVRNLTQITLPSKEDLDRIQSDLRFKYNAVVLDEFGIKKAEGIIYYVIKDNILYSYMPDDLKQSEEVMESPDEYFERRTKHLASLDEIGKEIVKIPEWSKCKNKNQRSFVIEKYLISIQNKDFFTPSDIEMIGDYTKLYFEEV